MKTRLAFLVLFGLLACNFAAAQTENKLPETSVKKLLALQHLKKGRAMKLNFSSSDGIAQTFKIKEVTGIIPLKLRQKYPRIKSYFGADGEDILSLTVVGNRVFGNAVIADELIKIQNRNASYKGARTFEVSKSKHEPVCGDFNSANSISKENASQKLKKIESFNGRAFSKTEVLNSSRGSSLKTYDLVLTVTGKQNQNLGNTTIEEGLAYAASIVNFVNGVFRRELAVQYRLHPENDKVIYLNPEADPYPATAVDDMLEIIGTHNQTVFSLFSEDSFDTGFIIHPSRIGRGGGRPGNASRAYLGSCGCSGLILHELAHHLGGRHSYHLDRSNEVSALQHSMVGNNSSFIHSFNLDEIISVIENYPAGEDSVIGNTIPEISIDIDGLSIPKQTPFVLSGVAEDADAEAILTYAWQQVEVGSNDTDRLLFAHQTPFQQGSLRYIPSLPSVLNNRMDNYSLLPEVNQEIVARMVVRDNQLPVGAIAFEEVRIQVDASAGPFMVTYPNTAVEVFEGDEMQVTWDVANTNNQKVNVQEVAILVSADGGATWQDIATATPNDGEEIIIIPALTSEHCRIMIKASTNIFYAINDAEFTIQETIDVAEESTSTDTSMMSFYNDISNAHTNLVTVSTAFTPNGDGINDTWIIKDINKFPKATVTVYDQKGALVFGKKGYQNNWSATEADGANKLPSGSYYYVLKLGDGSPTKDGWVFINY